jgi:hypothetical protein
LENDLLDEGAPYVVKDPWLFTYCDDVDPAKVVVEALIVPMRDLITAAKSRVLQERMAVAESLWRNRPVTDVRGAVDGGIIYSLDPVDQARILAVGFYRLIHWATRSGIPLFLLEFPRAIEDSGYLVDALSRCWSPIVQGRRR